MDADSCIRFCGNHGNPTLNQTLRPGAGIRKKAYPNLSDQRILGTTR